MKLECTVFVMTLLSTFHENLFLNMLSSEPSHARLLIQTFRPPTKGRCDSQAMSKNYALPPIYPKGKLN